MGVRGLPRHGADGHVDHLLVFVDLSAGHARLGGSALAQVFKQLGDTAPDCDVRMLKRACRETQRLLREHVLLADHDRLAGGLLMVCLCGCEMDVTTDVSVMVMGVVVDDTKVVQVSSFSSKDAGGEPREGDG